MTHDEYSIIPGINSTAIKAGRTSMKHMHAVMMDGGDTDTASTSLGKQLHAAILEPDRFHRDNRIFDGVRRGEKWEAFKAGCPDHELIMKPEEFRAIVLIHRAVMANDQAAKLLADSDVEQTIRWTGEHYGEAKARLDAINHGAIIDIKSTSQIGQFARQFLRYGYDIQSGWYFEGAEKCGLGVERVVIIAIESNPPFDVAVFAVPKLAVEVGRKRARQIAAQYRQCEAAGRFPGVVDGIAELILPDWYGEGEISAAFAELAASEL